MFGWEFPPHISGGLGTACYGITTALLKQGVQITFVVPRLYGDEDAATFRLVSASGTFIDLSEPGFQKWKERLEYIEAQSALAPYSTDQATTITSGVSGLHEEAISAFSHKFQLSGKYDEHLLEEVQKYALIGAKIAAEYDHDIIHAHDWLTYQAGLAAREVSGKPLIIHVHATEYDRSGENVNVPVFEIEEEGMTQADHIIAVSEYTRQIIINKYGIPAEKVSVVHNGILPKPFHLKQSKPVKDKIVTFMGRITYQKGPEYFIEAANKVLKMVPNVRFVMAGSGDMMHRMVLRAAQLKISSRFHFTGFLKGDEVDRMYGMSDVFVMPSVSEPFGIAPLEAMQADVPVIISKQSGVSEVLDNAIKVDFWDVDALADAIAAVLQYKGLAQAFRQNGTDDIRKLNWDNTGIKIKNIYESTTKQLV
ncbi:Poly(glycerol-phosphate) alpha-glucosyltransferase [Fulvivirga imtechensis AK7]|uniref:Poly(Glycerol-phosphate) alpha-glucosyltransferase n=2 Tax=Fulvivirga TaxID=396811 RepID=L8JPP0_9BACT|nr:Poly(glycerol-phosphate) alpha-glucosyltransferase [Fulvivirga imtechensis AK7]